MLVIRLFLGFSAFVWLPYGIFCFLQPGYLTEAAGLGLTSATATTEVRAMYGGLQAGLAIWLLGRSGSVVHAPAH